MSEHTKGRADTVATGRKQPPTEREALRAELNAARALLREVVECNWTLDPFGAIKKHKQAKDYLDACDTPEGAPNAG